MVGTIITRGRNSGLKCLSTNLRSGVILFFNLFCFFCFFASLAERHKGIIGRGHDLRLFVYRLSPPVSLPLPCYFSPNREPVHTFILNEIFRQETEMSIAPKNDYWCEIILLSRAWEWQLLNPRPRGGGGGYSWEFLVGVCRPVLQILTQFQTHKCNFPHPFSD